MHRLFVALRPPKAIRARLIGLMEGVAGARWQSDDQLHLTLRFIGEADRHQADDIVAALGAIHHPVFQIALSGIGSFDRRGRIDMVWAGVTPHEPLRALHNKVDQALARAGIAPESRAYHPHITLARLKRDSRPIAALVERSGGLASAPFGIDSFALYESTLTPQGAVYTVAERYPLTPA